MKQLRHLFLLSALIAPLAGCDSGGDAPCIIDSDCADFQLVCIDQVCTRPSTTGVDAGPGTDAGPAPEVDAGPEVDSGEGADAGPGTDAGPLMDGMIPDAGAMNCTDLTGSWMVSAIVAAPCGTTAVGYGATITPAGTDCNFTIASTNVAEPAADGTIVLDPTDAFNPAVTSLGVGGGVATNCNGNVLSGTLTISCGGCVMQMTQP